MKYKVGQKVMVREDAVYDEKYKGKTAKIGLVKKTYYVLYFQDCEDTIVEGFVDSDLEPVVNRSKVGKKAYKTFLKNGGSRNSKGQFSKKQKIDWEKIGKELSSTYFNGNNVFESKENVKAFAKVFQKHGLIDKGVKI